MYRVFHFLYQILVGLCQKYFKGQPELNLGPWAVVTGATDGIGKEYAEQLAAMGLHIVLISRTEAKLVAMATQLQANYGIQVRTIPVDFTSGLQIYPKIAESLQGLEIGTLINNVGTTSEYPAYFHETDDTGCLNLLNCNILSTTLMTKMVIPGMAARRNGYIVNVGSLAAEVSFPFLSLYAATKAFGDKLALDLGLEYGDQGVVIQSLVPCCVATKMSRIGKPSLFAPSPADFVRSALKGLGTKSRTTGYWAHTLQMVWFRFLRMALGSWFGKYNLAVMNRWRLIARANRTYLQICNSKEVLKK